LYTVFLEEHGYNVRVVGSYLAVFHASQERYQVIPVPDLRIEVREALSVREQNLKDPLFCAVERLGWNIQVVTTDASDANCKHLSLCADPAGADTVPEGKASVSFGAVCSDCGFSACCSKNEKE
jgi:hypothetical protein